VYTFLLVDALRLPEDAMGTFRAGELVVPAMVVAHEGNRVWLLLEAADRLPPSIPLGRLELTQTDLLERLRERMQELADGGDLGMAPKVFGAVAATTSWSTLPAATADRIHDAGTRRVLEQALGSEVTFLWGPPGTGKTFAIAALVAALTAQGETVLVTSHTHAAVEQALWAAVEPAGGGRLAGLLHGSSLIRDGRILKVGPLRQAKIPNACHLDGRLEEQATAHKDELAATLVRLAVIDGERDRCRRALEPWLELERADTATREAGRAREEATRLLAQRQEQQYAAAAVLAAARDALTGAERSFLVGRKGRVEKARAAVAAATAKVRSAEVASVWSENALATHQRRLDETTATQLAARAATTGLPERDWLTAEIARIEEAATGLRADAEALRGADDNLANQLLDDALAVFATLTKLYIDPKLRDRTWDTVVVDEASMATPPLIAWAAARSRRRVVICGDFRQLPPITHSRDQQVADVLGQDLFQLRGIPACIDQEGSPDQLAQLSIQRRMHPAIADIARTLCYRNDQLGDDPSTRRLPPPWCSALGIAEATTPAKSAARSASTTAPPVLVVDTSPLHSWCGKLRGSLSRFNFYSAQVAVELAALYAAQAPKPEPDEARPIGLITPYAAQRRYLSRLVESMGELASWVTVGTIHTFQGSECDLIIFDSVLADPIGALGSPTPTCTARSGATSMSP
jgi:hypothetical protein